MVMKSTTKQGRTRKEVFRWEERRRRRRWCCTPFKYNAPKAMAGKRPVRDKVVPSASRRRRTTTMMKVRVRRVRIRIACKRNDDEAMAGKRPVRDKVVPPAARRRTTTTTMRVRVRVRIACKRNNDEAMAGRRPVRDKVVPSAARRRRTTTTMRVRVCRVRIRIACKRNGDEAMAGRRPVRDKVVPSASRRRRTTTTMRVRVRVRVARKRNDDDGDEGVIVRKSGEEEKEEDEEDEEEEEPEQEQEQKQEIEEKEEEEEEEEEPEQKQEIEEEEEEEEPDEEPEEEQEEEIEEEEAIPPEHRRRLMKYDLLYWIIALTGSVMYGSDMIIAEGLLLLDAFLVTFFPRSYVEKSFSSIDSYYCEYSDWTMRLFALLPFALGWVFGSSVIVLRRIYGPRLMMLVSFFLVIIGGLTSAVTYEPAILISGRVFVGIGLALARQVIPVFLEEVPPTEKREKLGIAFEWGLHVGNLVGNVIIQNEVVKNFSWRWALVPTIIFSLVLLLCSLCVEESPKSCIERGKHDKAFSILKRSRDYGVQEEYLRLVDEATRRQHTFVEIMKRDNRPYLTISIVSIIFQCFMGASTLLLFLPTFLVVGIDSNVESALLSSIIACSVSIVASGFSVYSTKRFQRRRISLLTACVVMVLAQLMIWIIFLKWLYPTTELKTGVRHLITATMCIFVFASTVASGPMGWLSSNYPRQLVASGRILTSSSNMVSSFVLAQVFLALLCQIQSWIFFLFAAVILAMFAFVYWFIPETTNMEDEEIVGVWRAHWFWGCCVNDVHGVAGQA